MKTKILFLMLFMSIISVSAFAEYAVIDGINYSLNDETLEAEVVSRGGYSGDIIIPETVDYDGKTYSVTSIGFAFYNCSDLTSVAIPNSVTTIGEYAFYGCSGLTSINIPNSVTTIGLAAFNECSGLTSINIPNSVTSIGYGAFDECSGLESIIVENGNTVYDSRENCNAIIETETNTLILGCKNTVIPNSVTTIGEKAFLECSGLTSITIPNSVTNIGNGAFYDCSGLTSITIPNSVTTIGEEAFWKCSGLTSITIPNSVTIISESAFWRCSGLTSVTIPNSVTNIGNGAFYDCSGLTSITVEKGNLAYNSRENCNAVIDSETNELILGCKNTVIPNSVTSIGNYAFYGCYGLTSITIPNSVTSIGYGAFFDCSGLTSVISLIEEPFEIEEYVFYADNYETEPYGFTSATLYVPAGTKEKYESTPAWNKFKNIVEGIENAVKSIETDAKAEETERYNVSGQRISSPQKGLNIVKMSDGTTRKVMCK